MKQVTNEFRSAYTYAQANGYTGKYGAYVELQYNAYVAICNRQSIAPLSFVEWAMG